jgi:hypothetical protein
VTDLSFVYKCGKCSRSFASPDQLKNHEIPCRGKRPAAEGTLLLSHREKKVLTTTPPGKDQSQAWTPRDRNIVFATEGTAITEAGNRARWLIDNSPPTPNESVTWGLDPT